MLLKTLVRGAYPSSNWRWHGTRFLSGSGGTGSLHSVAKWNSPGRIRLWTDQDIKRVQKELPGIKNGRSKRGKS